MFPTDTLAESYDYLSDQVANPPSRSWTLKRLIKSIGKNRYHVLLGTMISTSTLIAGGILFYGHLYQPFTGIYPDKDAFLSQQNFTDGNKYGHLYRDPPFFTHWGEDSPITFWNTNFWDKIPGYELLTNRNNCHDGGKCDGNVTTWIRHLSLDTGCSFDYWYAQLQSVINNTDIFNQTILPCHPSPDNKTICCGTIWDGYKDWKRDTWHCEQRYCMRMFYGNFDSLVESYNKSLLSWEMKQNLRLGLFYVYCIFAAPLFSLTYVWIMLWTHYCL